jgi:putative (di)nucleoside polyphosphate hydrolase
MSSSKLHILPSVNEDSPCTFRAIADKRVRFIWEITAKCNLPCWYCFRTDPSTGSTDQDFLESIAVQFDASITDSVLLTGGEPFLLPHFARLIAILVGRGIHVKIATNLTFNDKVLRSVPDIHQVDISTSIDGFDDASHDRIRGNGSARRIRDNVQYLKSLGRPVSARCVLTEQNILQAERVVMMAMDMEFSSLTFSRLTTVPDPSALNIDNSYDSALPSEEKMAWFRLLIPTLRVKYPAFPLRTAGFAKSSSQCSAAGSSLAYITSHGILHPCTLYRVEDSRLDLRNYSLESALVTLGSISRSQGRSTCPCLTVEANPTAATLTETTTLEDTRMREAVGAVVEHNGRFLLVHKVKAMDTIGGPTEMDGEWGFPGGGIRKCEDIQIALRRELSEETGLLTYSSDKELPAIRFEFSPEYRRRSGFERQHTRMFLVRCEQPSEIATTNPEIDSAKFFTREEVLSMLHHQSAKDYFQSLVNSGLLD